MRARAFCDLFCFGEVRRGEVWCGVGLWCAIDGTYIRRREFVSGSELVLCREAIGLDGSLTFRRVFHR